MYASKRRQRNFKRVREPSKPNTSTNPSKRHRERLNGELETVAQLLPYDTTTISRLDKLSVLRLAVSYLQVKSHFQACHHSTSFVSPFPPPTHSYCFAPPPLTFLGVPTIHHPNTGQTLIDAKEHQFETVAMKALGGFILIINDNGEIYFASENVEHFLGFHQSDILHQPLFDLIHSEDREDIRQQLDVAFSLPPGSSNQQDAFSVENLIYLDRNVNARFRCLLDNTCGFLRIDMRGKLLSLHGLPSSYVMGRSSSGPVMGMVVVCTPFVPPSSSDVPPDDLILKTKHHLDGTLVSMDPKMHVMLELSESELPVSFYQTIHVEDAVCLAEAHKEVLKNGSSGLLIYRLIAAKSRRVYYVQSSCRMFYKNGKPESIGLTHRVLNEVEGNMLLEKRSSLKAKLLSFDDSFLQSPRNLQGTAALPLPAAKEDFAEDESSFSGSFPLAASRLRKKNDVIAAPTALVPKIPLEPWQLLHQPMPEFAPSFPLPPPFHPELHNWNMDGWAGEIYAQAYQPTTLPVAYPTGSLQSMNSMPPYPELANLDYPWTTQALPVSMPQPLSLPDILPLDHQSSNLTKDMHHIDYSQHYAKFQMPSSADYPNISAVLSNASSSNGFNLISEVTNTLLSQ